MEVRPTVKSFAELMEHRLQDKDDERGERGWTDTHPLWLLARAEEELAELKTCLVHGSDPDDVVREAVDTSNFCMMVADIVLQYEKRKKEETK